MVIAPFFCSVVLIGCKEKNKVALEKFLPKIHKLNFISDETRLNEVYKIMGLDTCTPMFIAALLTIAKTWKEPKCPSTDEWMKKMWYTYTMEYYSAIKKNKAICSNMDGPGDYHTK